MKKKKIEDAKNKFQSWFNANSISLKELAIKNIQEGKNLVLSIENDLLYEARYKPISFIYIYYQYLKVPEFGSNKILIYSSDLSFNLDFNIDSNLFTVENKNGFKLYVNGFLEDRREFRYNLDDKLKPIILNVTNPDEVQRAFLTQELALSDFKKKYYSYKYKKSRHYKHRKYREYGYTKFRYIDYGPFHWLRKENFFNPGTISRKLNSATFIRSEKSKSFFKKKYRIDNTEKVQEKIKDLYNVGHLNDRIAKNNYSKPSNQPFVKNKQEILNQTKVGGVRQHRSEKNPIRSFKDNDEQDFKKSFEAKDSGDKHLKTKTQIYILLTPFQVGDKIEIKVGESTNIKSRIDTYRQYWRDKFKVVFISDGIVEDEKKLKLKLEKFHESNEFFRVDIKTMQIIAKSTSFHELLQNLEMYS